MPVYPGALWIDRRLIIFLRSLSCTSGDFATTACLGLWRERTLKHESQPNLDLTSRSATRDQSEAGTAQSRARAAEVSTVRHVECLSSQLDALRFGDGEIPQDRQIHRHDARRPHQ